MFKLSSCLAELTCTVADSARGFLLGEFGLSATDSLFAGDRLIGAELGRVARLFCRENAMTLYIWDKKGKLRL